MKRKIIGVLAGLVAWAAIGFAAGLVLRAAWPEYVAVSESMTFTLSMQITRLVIGAIATIGAGFVAAWIAKSIIVGAIPGVILLAVFIPQHIMLWDKFPLWYHLIFLLTLVPLSYLGGRLGARH
jgi:hypothetical protein